MIYGDKKFLKDNWKFTKEKINRRPLSMKGEVINVFNSYVKDKNFQILDCGVGSGEFLRVIKDNGFKNIQGCDLDEYVRDEYRGKFDIKLVDFSFEKLPWGDESFEVVTCWETMEHLENPYNFIREVDRVLKPGGLYLFSVPNVFHIVSKLIFLKRGHFPRWSKDNNHVALLPRGIFEKMFLDKFDLVKEEFTYPKISLPILKYINFLPSNRWFGNWVYYILKKK